MLVDYQAAWLALVDEVRSRPSHGRAQLLARMTEIQAEAAVDEDADAATIRRLSVRLEEMFLNLTPDGAPSPLDQAVRQTAGAMGRGPALRQTTEVPCPTASTAQT